MIATAWWVRIDKTRKLSAQVLLKALGLSDNEFLMPCVTQSIFKEKKKAVFQRRCLMELYKNYVPEPPTVLGGQQLLDSRF